MIRSMTGFGQANRVFAGYSLQMDLKSVNHRFCEVLIRMPREWLKFEDMLKNTVQRSVKRGRLDVYVTMERQTDAVRSAEVNWTLAEAYYSAAEQLQERFGLEASLQTSDFLRIPDLVVLKEDAGVSEEEVAQALEACIQDAVTELIRMREAEGAHLYADTVRRIGALADLTEQAERIAPQIVSDYAEKLRNRIRELAHEPLVDEIRLATEIAMFADRCSVDEEITRLRSHLQQCGHMLDSPEPVGRKLDFLIQEMNREVNTIGSKANDVGLAGLVVEMKAELEKIREQIQNIE